QMLRLAARRTWRYFERFVTEEDNWLPPDNYQEDLGVVAHRTSPTNIGLYLLTVLSAREFGWIGRGEAVSRLEATLATLGRMEQFRGHLFNWYDTVSLEPLAPRYVSTVDSGNLAGHLLAVSEGFDRLPQQASGPEVIAALRDTALLIRQAADRLASPPVEFVSPRDLDSAVTDLLTSLTHAVGTGWPDGQTEVEQKAETVADIARTLATGPDDDELAYWAEALMATLASHRADRVVSADPERRARLDRRQAGLAASTA